MDDTPKIYNGVTLEGARKSAWFVVRIGRNGSDTIKRAFTKKRDAELQAARLSEDDPDSIYGVAMLTRTFHQEEMEVVKVERKTVEFAVTA